MKKISLIAVVTMLTLSVFAQTNSSFTKVNAYYKKDGTYVPAHYRTNPNYTAKDNYTTKPNVNPFTGKTGTIDINSTSYDELVNYYNSINNVNTKSNPSYNYNIPDYKLDNQLNSISNSKSNNYENTYQNTNNSSSDYFDNYFNSINSSGSSNYSNTNSNSNNSNNGGYFNNYFNSIK